jgi:guanylate kinase
MKRDSRAFPVVLSGPSGVGKTTIEDRLVTADPKLVASVSTTTRPPRDGEESGRDYFFVERDVFEQMKERELVEWAEVHGEWYGTPRRFIENEMAAGHDVLLNIDVQGGLGVKKIFPEAVMIFILPPSFETLKQRILKRGQDDDHDLETRLDNAVEEINASSNYDYYVVNDELGDAVDKIQSIIDAERCRKKRHDAGFIAGIGRQNKT